MSQIFLTIDLGFGDSGKGSVTDYLVRQEKASAVVRYNGGAQAAHNVVTSGGKHHTFAQFGSGTLAGAKTFLSRFVMVNPLNLLNEEMGLQRIGITDGFERIAVAGGCLVTTPFHIAANRLKEMARGDGRHGSTGLGVGETRYDFNRFGDDVLFVQDLLDPDLTRKKMKFLRDLKWEEMGPIFGSIDIPSTGDRVRRDAAEEWECLDGDDAMEEALAQYKRFIDNVRVVRNEGEYLAELADEGSLIFEAAQGVLLDEWHGFHPYTTWSSTTFDNANTLFDEMNDADLPVFTIGIMRAYQTRHGVGPFPTHDESVTQHIREPHNTVNEWQGELRGGHPDMLMTQYAMEVAGETIDALAVTCLDQLEGHEWSICDRYVYRGSLHDLRPYFAMERDGTISAIRPTPDVYRDDAPHDYSHAHTEALTSRLADCSAVLNPLGHVHPDELVRHFESHLDAPVWIESFGPSASEKKIRALQR